MYPILYSRNAQENRTINYYHSFLTHLYLCHGSCGPLEEHREYRLHVQGLHWHQNQRPDCGQQFPSSSSVSQYQNVYFFASQHVLCAVANMLLDIAVLEFVCSQSPYSMKGLLLGIFFSVKSLFQGIALTSILPFGAWWNIRSLHCGSGFYLMNIILGLLELVLYSCASKRYKYRKLNEPSNEYRSALCRKLLLKYTTENAISVHVHIIAMSTCHISFQVIIFHYPVRTCAARGYVIGRGVYIYI